MRGCIGMLAGIAILPLTTAADAAPGGRTMNVGHAPVARSGGWGPGGWNRGPGVGIPGGGVRGGWNGNGGFRGRWPGGFGGYRRPFVGYVLPGGWYSPTYAISNYGGYGLGAPGIGTGWYRYYDDAVLVDGGGAVRDWRSGIDWDRDVAADDPADRAYDDGYDDGFDDGVDYAEDAVGYRGKFKRGKAPKGDRRGHGYGVAGRPQLPPPPGDRYGYGVNTYRSAPCSYPAGPGTTVYGCPGGATVVVVQSAPQTMTTTTTTTSYVTTTPRHVWHAPATKTVWRAKPQPKGKTLRR